MPVIFFRPQTLESIARKSLSEYDAAYLGRPPGPVPIETIIEKTNGLSIEYKYLTNDGIDSNMIKKEFTQGSFPYEFLSGLAHDEEALQIAYDLLRRE